MEPIISTSLWHGGELSKTKDWVREFSPKEITEVEAAIDLCRPQPIQDIQLKDFPLPTLAPLLVNLRHELIDGKGFALLRGLPTNNWSREDVIRAYWGLGVHLGHPVSQNPEGHLLGHVQDIGGDFNDPNSRGGYLSHARLPFHTDVGADIVGLLCLRRAKAGGFSSIVSVAAIYNKMLAQRPDLVEELTRPIFRDRRGEMPPGKAPFYSAPVYSLHEGRLTTTFVRRFIDSAPRHTGIPSLGPKLIEALDLFESLANDTFLRLDMDFQTGDIQLINNLTLLHARTSFEDFTDPADKRHLLRLWLAVPDGWPLPDYYFERFGSLTDTGRPAGMAFPGVAPTVPHDVP